MYFNEFFCKLEMCIKLKKKHTETSADRSQNEVNSVKCPSNFFCFGRYMHS